MSLRIEGGQALARDLRQLPAKVRGQVLVAALRVAAEPMRHTMQTLAPHEPGPPDIRANIVISRVTSLSSDDGGPREKLDDLAAAVAIGPAKGFFYGHFLEYGTVKARAQPFMRPAFDRDAPVALQLLARELGEALIAEGVRGSRGNATAGGGML